MNELEGIRIEDDWLQDTSLQKLFDILEQDGAVARVAGGAVRNALMAKLASDVDLCTTLPPDHVVQRLEKAGEKAVPTGIEHGTVTAIIDGNPFEVTTLRQDVETDGRHAVVKFGTDWETDAKRRDFTINALYCDREGRVFDPVGGYQDIQDGEIRFIGDAGARIAEDSLRILRFFRFFAWYGDGRPDAAGLKACSANKHLLDGLSAERVWMELKKLLAADDPGRALLWMRTTGVLTRILPETEKWGIDALPGLIGLEDSETWQKDPMLRLMAMIRPHEDTVAGLSARLSLSNAESGRLQAWAGSEPPKPDTPTDDLDKTLYKGSSEGIIDALRLEIVHLLGRDEATNANRALGLLDHAESWKRPEMPVKGRDLVDLGFSSGPEMGAVLKKLENLWVEGGFKASKKDLLASDVISGPR